MDGNAVVPLEQITRDVKFGRTLTVIDRALKSLAVTGCISVASFGSVCMLISSGDADELYHFGGRYIKHTHTWMSGFPSGPEKNTSMTACFMVILIWWTVFSMALFIVNIMLTKKFSLSHYDIVYKWAPKISVMNALGTNVAIVVGLSYFFSDNQYSGLTGVGVILFLLAPIQAALSLILFARGRPIRACDLKPKANKDTEIRASFNC